MKQNFGEHNSCILAVPRRFLAMLVCELGFTVFSWTRLWLSYHYFHLPHFFKENANSCIAFLRNSCRNVNSCIALDGKEQCTEVSVEELHLWTRETRKESLKKKNDERGRLQIWWNFCLN